MVTGKKQSWQNHSPVRALPAPGEGTQPGWVHGPGWAQSTFLRLFAMDFAGLCQRHRREAVRGRRASWQAAEHQEQELGEQPTAQCQPVGPPAWPHPALALLWHEPRCQRQSNAASGQQHGGRNEPEKPRQMFLKALLTSLQGEEEIPVPLELLHELFVLQEERDPLVLQVLLPPPLLLQGAVAPRDEPPRHGLPAAVGALSRRQTWQRSVSGVGACTGACRRLPAAHTPQAELGLLLLHCCTPSPDSPQPLPSGVPLSYTQRLTARDSVPAAGLRSGRCCCGGDKGGQGTTAGARREGGWGRGRRGRTPHTGMGTTRSGVRVAQGGTGASERAPLQSTDLQRFLTLNCGVEPEPGVEAREKGLSRRRCFYFLLSKKQRLQFPADKRPYVRHLTLSPGSRWVHTWGAAEPRCTAATSSSPAIFI